MKQFLKIYLLSAVFMFTMNAFAQEKGISKEVLQQIRSKIKPDKDLKMRMNAIANGRIDELSLNNENKGNTDHFFKYKVKTSGISDQESSGRCWLFTGLNVLKPKVIEKLNISEFEFSQNYSFFYDQLEKSNLFLQAIIDTRNLPNDDRKIEWLFKNSIGDGGQWTGVVTIITKYGVVPKEVMPETKNSNSTGLINRLLTWKLNEFGLELRENAAKGTKESELISTKINMLGDIYKMLVIAYGEPPQEFQWRYKNKDGNLSEYKTYTPKSFYDEVVGIDLNDYVMFMNDPSREYGKLYEIEYDRHAYDGNNWKYINLETAKIKEFALKSIMGNDAMYFSCDVGKQLNAKDGFLDMNNFDYEALMDVEFNMDKKQRIQSYGSSSSHGMTLVAVDVDKDNKPTKWQLENSWGSSSGNNGYLTMTDQWFDEYMFRIVIHKKYISENILKILEQKPVVLPPWDPMF